MASEILAKKGIVRFAYEGKVSYGQYRGNRIYIYEGSPFSGGKPGKNTVALSKVKLLAPCRPSKVVAIGLNYKLHAKEVGKDLPTEPMIFIKPSTSVIGPDETIIRPGHMSKRVDYEAELAIVIGKTCRMVSAEKAPDYILGYTCLNDVTARDLQALDVQYIRAKGFDTFCPLGPIVAQDIDPNEVGVKSILNGEVKQDSNTNDLIFDVFKLVEFVSAVMTLKAGDVIATGTPAGIGPMLDGDEIVVELEGIGRLANPVKD